MKKRVVKKVERMMLVDKVCELQRLVCEHERFLGDLLILVATKKTDNLVLKHGVETGGYIWEEIVKLIKENADLREKGRIGDSADPEHSAGL